MLSRCNIYAFTLQYLCFCIVTSILLRNYILPLPFLSSFSCFISDKKSINKNIWWYRKKRFVVQTIPRIIYYARSPLACSPCSKSITDNSDATDLFFSRIIIWLSLYLDFHAPVRRFDFHGFLYAVDFQLFSLRYVSLWLLCAVGNPRRTGANIIRNKSKTNKSKN